MTYGPLINNIQTMSDKKVVSKTTALVESGAGEDFIVNIEKGQKPPINKLNMLASYFDVSVDCLLGNPLAPNVDLSQSIPYNKDGMIPIPVIRRVPTK